MVRREEPARGPARTDENEDALARLFVWRVRTAPAAVLLQLQALPGVGLALRRHVVAPLALLACEVDRRPFVTCHCRVSSLPPPAEGGGRCPSGTEGGFLVSGGRCPSGTEGDFLTTIYLMILVTRPAPTVRPPSRIAKRRPSSIAIDFPNTTVISVLSPGITISVPAGNDTEPVTSVVRK